MSIQLVLVSYRKWSGVLPVVLCYVQWTFTAASIRVTDDFTPPYPI